MPQPQQQRQPFPPPPPAQPVQEGARWRWHRPSSDAVAAWFNTQPLDDEMKHEDYVGGVVLIPQSEKVKYTNPDGRGTTERYEMVFTPYVQIGTRVAYFRRLAEGRGLIPWNGPAKVPKSINPESMYFNGNMPDGLWWHVVKGDSGPVRYLCCTWEVMFYEPISYAAKLKGEDPLPVLYGTGTKQVGGGPDPNGLMKAQTGAYGRALGAAGILVVGTGIASAEDMQEYQGPPMPAVGPEGAQLQSPTEIAPGAAPEPTDPAEAMAQLRSRAMAVQAQMQEGTPDTWREFAAWWQERSSQEGWSKIDDVPYEALKGIVSRMERMYAEATAEKLREAVANAATEVPPQEGAS